MENFTGVAAPKLVRFAGVLSDSRVLDVACGTGVAALTAARSGAKVTGADLTPDLIARANENNKILGLDIDFHEADVEDEAHDAHVGKHVSSLILGSLRGEVEGAKMLVLIGVAPNREIFLNILEGGL